LFLDHSGILVISQTQAKEGVIKVSKVIKSGRSPNTVPLAPLPTTLPPPLPTNCGNDHKATTI